MRVDGTDQSEATGATMWGRRARPTFITYASTAALDWVEGQHDGYTRLPSAVIHRRAVAFVRPDYFVVVDWLVGGGRHSFEQFFHFPAEAVARVEGGRCVVQVNGREATFLLSAGDDTEVRLVIGQVQPIQGWLSPRFGQKVASPTLVHHWNGSCPAAMVTVIWLGQGIPPVWEPRGESAPTALCFGLRAAGWRDEFFIGLHPPATAVQVGGQTCDQRICYARSIGGQVTQAVRLD